MRMTDAIVARFRDGLEQATEAGIPEPTAMTLATCGAENRPAARTVLLKGYDAEGFVFYTNLGSRKGRELRANPRVCLLFWWREIEQQVIIEGGAGQVPDAEADAYFASRPRGSQIGAWASKQSRPLPDRQTLLARIAEVEREFEDRDVPRPAHWSGFRVDPARIEFWYGRQFRWHERILHTATPDGWEQGLLYP